MKYTSSYGGEFEITEADRARVDPLGSPDEIEDDDERRRMLAVLLKGIVNTGGLDRYLPYGHWDAFLDESDWVHDDVAHPDCTDVFDCPEEHQIWRPGSPERDSVFVRLQTDIHSDPLWDLEVMTRPRMSSTGVETDAIVTIGATGEEYTPEQCINDFGVLLSVFRLFVQQGKLA